MRKVARIVKRRVTALAREGDGQLAARIGIAKQDVGYGVTTLTARLPSFEDRRNVLCRPIDAQRTAIQEDQDHGLAEGQRQS